MNSTKDIEVIQVETSKVFTNKTIDTCVLLQAHVGQHLNYNETVCRSRCALMAK